VISRLLQEREELEGQHDTSQSFR